jgi:hypothetical protein
MGPDGQWIFVNNYLNNHNFNNKSDKVKNLRIWMTTRPLSMALCKDVTGSGVFFFLLFNYFSLNKLSTPVWVTFLPLALLSSCDTLFFKKRKEKWKMSLPIASLHKHANGTDAFTQRHWQCRAAIRILNFFYFITLIIKIRIFLNNYYQKSLISSSFYTSTE